MLRRITSLVDLQRNARRNALVSLEELRQINADRREADVAVPDRPAHLPLR